MSQERVSEVRQVTSKPLVEAVVVPLQTISVDMSRQSLGNSDEIVNIVKIDEEKFVNVLAAKSEVGNQEDK